MLNIDQFKEYILQPALDDLQLFSDDAMELLIFTCAAESDGGTFVRQIKGPAEGIFQMEPGTHDDIWYNYVKYRAHYMHILAIKFECPITPMSDRMVYDLRYAAAMARLHYARVQEPLPNKDDVNAIWEYYKKYYNTPNGKATKAKAIKAYERFTGRSLKKADS